MCGGRARRHRRQLVDAMVAGWSAMVELYCMVHYNESQGAEAMERCAAV